MIEESGFDFVFDERKCVECGGACCIGESGYIFLELSEAQTIAEFLGLSLEEFSKRFLRQVGTRYSLIEKPHSSGKACIFFDDKFKCTIYSVRPKNCQTFPFWDIFKNNTKGACRECIGVVEK